MGTITLDEIALAILCAGILSLGMTFVGTVALVARMLLEAPDEDRREA